MGNMSGESQRQREEMPASPDQNESQVLLTEQQRAAIETRTTSVALSAGAGCGKTFVLTRRYLSHLQPGPDAAELQSIVAITFTERAAREMRDRIRDACRKELQRCSNADVPHWIQILRGLDSARISTIHSFCASLLRTHAVEAGLDPQFQLLDQPSSQAVLRAEAERTIRELLAKHDPHCMQLIQEYGPERLLEYVCSFAVQRFEVDEASFEHHSESSLQSYWLECWRDKFVPDILRRISEHHTVREVLAVLREFEPSNRQMQERREFLLRELPNLAESSDPEAHLAELRSHALVKGGGGKSAWLNESIQERVTVAFKALRELIDKTTKRLTYSMVDVQVAVGHGIAATRVTSEVIKNYAAAKQASGQLDFDDLLLATRDLMRGSEMARRRAVSSIQLLLVDEFQDTDPVQTEIVRALCGKGLQTGKLFLVGDAKQSIYRFRRADPRVFQELRQELPESGRLPLSMNFRSQPAVLDFVNFLFEPSMRPDYEPLIPFEDNQASPTPAVEFLFPTADESQERVNAEDRRRIEAQAIAGRIRALLDDPIPRIRDRDPDTGEETLRCVQLGDIAILFRALTNVALYEDAFRQAGLDYYLVGGKAFFAQQEVFDLVNLCQCLEDCDDDVSLVGVLRSPFFGLSDDTIVALCQQSQSLFDALQQPTPDWISEPQQQQVNQARRVLNDLRRNKNRLPIVDLLNRALTETGYDASLLHEFMGRRKLANLKKLIDSARQFDMSGTFTLSDFIVRMRNSIAEESDEELAATHPETSDVIRLMTIHQSKGLEFPIVIVADMDWKPGGKRSPAHYHPQLGPLLPLTRKFGQERKNLGQRMHQLEEEPQDEAETIRLFYVAVTRAADYLILSGCLPANRNVTSPWLKLLSERFDLSTGLPAGDPYFGRTSTGADSQPTIPDILVHHDFPRVQGTKSEASSSKFFESPWEFVEDAEPVPLPSTYLSCSVRRQHHRRLSPSQIEQSDAKIRAGIPSEEVASEPSIDSGSVLPTNVDENYAEKLGTFVHYVLERLDLKNCDNPESFVEQCAANLAGPIDERMIADATSRLLAFVNSEFALELQSASRLYREVDFHLQWPHVSSGSNSPVRITGIIDCFYQLPNGEWTVADYKTGHRLMTEADAKVINAYEMQLGIYALAVQQMFQSSPDHVAIVLLGDSSVRRVDWDLSSEKIDEIVSRLDAAIAL